MISIAHFSRLFAIALTSLLTGEVIGQWDARIVAGGGFGRIRSDESPLPNRGEYQVVEVRPSFLLGASLGHKIAGPLNFSIGMHWVMLNGHDEYWILDYKYSEADRRIHYVFVPMLAQFVFHGVHLGLGYQLGVPFSEHGAFATYYSAYGLEDVYSSTRRLGIKKTDIGVVVEGGYHLTGRFDLAARYYHGLQNIKDPKDGTTGQLYTEQLMLSIGYRMVCQRKAKPTDETPLAPAGRPIE